MPETPKTVFRAFASKRKPSRWCFTAHELRHPESCHAKDYFVAPLPEQLGFGHLGVLVRRDGTATNRWSDSGMPGVPLLLRQYAASVDILWKIAQANPAQNEDDEEVEEWRSVIQDTSGRFIRFNGSPPARQVIDEL